jgi:enterochelin esterase family protein
VLTQTASPVVADDHALLTLPDRGLARVALVHELRRPRVVPFERQGSDWVLRLERPPVDRLEYLLELEGRDGGVQQIPDPTNPRRAPGAFGDKSVLEFPGYAEPAWVRDEESAGGAILETSLPSRLVRTSVDILIWAAAKTDPDVPLPLLLVHDGPEFARYSQLLRLFDHLVASGEVPPFRAALVPPPLDRNEMYSASHRYARVLAEEWVPALRQLAPSPGPLLALGASLGALSLLHAQWYEPGLFSGLFLQSGSFFRRRYDAHESGAPRYARITRFVSTVAGGRRTPDPIPVTITCGTGEENLDNNLFMAATLAAQGWEVRVVQHSDAHNWVSWRDVLHPHLAELLRQSG